MPTAPRTRTAGRSVAALLLAAAAGPFFGAPTPAFAATTTEPASTGAYYNEAGLTAPEGVPAVPPNPAASADGVAVGDLPVAYKAPSDKKSYVLFDLFDVEPGSTVTKAVVTMPLSDTSGSSQIQPAPEKVQACAVGPEGFAEADAQAYSLAPTVLCDDFMVAGQASSDGTAYTFDVTGLLPTWLDKENNGLALVAAVQEPFQVVFKPFADATLTVDATPPADEPAASPDVATPAPPVTSGGAVSGGSSGGSSSGGGSGSAGALGFGSDTSLFEPPSSTGTAQLPMLADPFTSGSTAGSGGLPAQSPIAAAVPDGSAIAPVALARRPLDASLGTSFWLAMVVGVAGLALLSLVLGDRTPRVVTTAGTRPNGVAARLQERKRPGARGLRPLTH